MIVKVLVFALCVGICSSETKYYEGCEDLLKNYAAHFAIRDRICILCGYYFNQDPALQYKCQQNCFKNDQFEQCTYIFGAPDIECKAASNTFDCEQRTRQKDIP